MSDSGKAFPCLEKSLLLFIADLSAFIHLLRTLIHCESNARRKKGNSTGCWSGPQLSWFCLCVCECVYRCRCESKCPTG